MRYSASEKLEIIELVEQSTLSVGRTLASIGIPRSTFYDWYGRYQDGGIEALEDGKPRPQRVWNKIPDEIGAAIVNLALDEPDLSPRELAVNFTDTKASFVSEASVYRLLKDHGLIASPAFILMKAADRFANPTTAPNQLWQTDFTYLKVIGWGWFYLSTVLDDFSRYILAWKLCTTMSAADVSDTLQLALKAAGLDQVNVLHRPRLLSDNGPSYVSSELGDWLKDKGIRHVRGRPYHPMTQGKIERYHRSMKNRILLENYYLPGQLELSIGEFVEYYNNRRYHESLDNLTPVDVYFGRGPAILKWRFMAAASIPEAISELTLAEQHVLANQPGEALNGTERAWMCAFLDPRCGSRDLRKNHPGSPERTWRASGSVLYPWRGLHHFWKRQGDVKL